MPPKHQNQDSVVTNAVTDGALLRRSLAAPVNCIAAHQKQEYGYTLTSELSPRQIGPFRRVHADGFALFMNEGTYTTSPVSVLASLVTKQRAEKCD